MRVEGMLMYISGSVVVIAADRDVQGEGGTVQRLCSSDAESNIHPRSIKGGGP